MAGMITWHELFTTDVDGRSRFYTELLGAEIETADMGDFEYQMLNKDGRTPRRLRQGRAGRRRRRTGTRTSTSTTSMRASQAATDARRDS